MSPDSMLFRLRKQARRSLRISRAFHKLKERIKAAWLYPWRRIIPARFEFGPPKGWFSLYENLKKGVIPGRIVSEENPQPHTTPQSLRALALLGQDEPLGYPIFWTKHHNARLIGPSLLLVNEQKCVSIEAAWGPICLNGDLSYRQFRRPAPIHLRGNWTSVRSYWDRGFHHWLADTLPRLALMNEFPPDTQVIVPPDLRQYQIDSLNWLGLEKRFRPTTEQHVVVENYFFSSPVAMSGGFSPYSVNFLRREFLDRRDRNFESGKKLYIRRLNVSRGIANDDEVTRFFAENGWGIFDTEQLTLAQQIQLFANAEQVCALHGAALTNLVWCRPGTRVVEIVSSTFMNGVYEGIAEAAQLDYAFLLCRGDTDFRAHVDMGALQRLLR